MSQQMQDAVKAYIQLSNDQDAGDSRPLCR